MATVLRVPLAPLVPLASLLALALLTACGGGGEASSSSSDRKAAVPSADRGAEAGTEDAPATAGDDAPAVDAGGATFTSAYTALDLDGCRETFRERDEGQAADWTCPGRNGVPLYVQMGDGRYDLDAGTPDPVLDGIGPFNDLGDTVEWRLKGGRPIAVIYRHLIAMPSMKGQTRLAVETIGRDGAPGCRIALIDGGAPDANRVAREQADARAERFRCGTDAEVRIDGSGAGHAWSAAPPAPARDR